MEIAEMTIAVPGSMDRRGSPAYPWSPDVIEAMPEEERAEYLKVLREYRRELNKKKK